jgi:hypothetical protein
MPLPSAVLNAARTRRFWSDYCFETEAREKDYPELEDIELEFIVNEDEDYGLSLVFSAWLGYFSLKLVTPIDSDEIAWDDQAHWHPHVLRWEELDLICRAVARRDSELPHPGLPLLFLHRFAPICVGDDVDQIISLLDKAWRDTGLFTDAEIQQKIEKYDARDAGFEWHLDNTRNLWWLGQNTTNTVASRGLYTLRHEESASSFMHENFAEMIDAAKKTTLTTLAGIPVPEGLLPSERPPPTEYTLRTKHRVSIELPILDEKRPMRNPHTRAVYPLDRILRDLNLGSAAISGARSRCNPNGQSSTTELYDVSVSVFGDIGYGMKIIRSVLQWARAPHTTRVNNPSYEELKCDLDEIEGGEGDLEEAFFQLAQIETELREDTKSVTISQNLPQSISEALQNTGQSEIEMVGPDSNGWYMLRLQDGGDLKICFSPIEINDEDENDDEESDSDERDDSDDESNEEDEQDSSDESNEALRKDGQDSIAMVKYVSGSIAIKELSPQAAGFLFRYMHSQNLILLPPGIITSEPPKELKFATHFVESETSLVGILKKGSKSWWRDIEDIVT